MGQVINNQGGRLMTEEKISTSTLLSRLFKTRHLGRFMEYYGSQMDGQPFSAHLGRLCEQRGLLPAHVIQRSGIERTFGHQIFNGRRAPSRDKVIQLAFGFGMDYDEAQTLLKIARKSALYPKIRRDAVIIYALDRDLSVIDLQDTLSELSLPVLGKE